MEKLDNNVNVKTTGAFELRDPISDITIGEKSVEVPETSFVTQMVALKRLEVVGGKVTQETDIEKENINPSIGEALPVKDSEPTIKDIIEKTPGRRGRPSQS